MAASFENAGTKGPRLLLLGGLGNPARGFHPLARILEEHARLVLFEYPHGGHDNRALARVIAEEVGPVDGVIASSMGGIVAAHLAHAGLTRGIAFIGAFTRLSQLGARRHLLPMMGPAAVFGRPSALLATLASASVIRSSVAHEIVPVAAADRRDVWRRAMAVRGEPEPASLRHAAISCTVLQGGRDLLVPPSTAHRLVADLPPGTRSHVLVTAGHVPYLTHAGEVARLITPWVASLL